MEGSGVQHKYSYDGPIEYKGWLIRRIPGDCDSCYKYMAILKECSMEQPWFILSKLREVKRRIDDWERMVAESSEYTE